MPTEQPTANPSVQPHTKPSGSPTSQPLRQPSAQPSSQPTMQPSNQPSVHPSSSAIGAKERITRLLTKDNNSKTPCLLEFKTPKDKYKIISKIHNSHVGHHGVYTSMNKRLATNSTTGKPYIEPWPQMREHIRRYIKSCP